MVTIFWNTKHKKNLDPFAKCEKSRVQIDEEKRCPVGMLGPSSSAAASDSWKESDVRHCSGNDLSAKSHMNGTSKPGI